MSGRLEFPNADAIPAGVWRWPHFDPKHEWACHGTGTIVIVPDFLDLLEELRMRVGFALPINSGYRSPEWNVRVGHSGEDGPHTTGKAADIRVHGLQAITLIVAAAQLGFVGIGVQQKGERIGRYIHLDTARDVPAIWSY